MPSSKTLRVNPHAVSLEIMEIAGSNPVGTTSYKIKALVIDQGFSYA